MNWTYCPAICRLNTKFYFATQHKIETLITLSTQVKTDLFFTL